MFLFYSFYMFFMGLSFLLLSLVSFLNNYSVLIYWNLLSILSNEINFMIYMDWISWSFMSIVLIISSMIMIYSIEYMVKEIYLNRFLYLILFFIISMMFMILSPNVVSILLGWDGLGLISYCLVIYYQNYSSMNAGMVTVLTNRVGDVGLLIMIGLLMSNNSWNLYLYEVKIWWVIIMLLMIAGLTKSAQIPFSSWLPSAMAAPTPVSALVHSSTLVTAGVYLFIRYNFIIMMNNLLSQVILLLSMFTMLMSGIMANFEYDLKKIVALSTLSQLALMMSILMLGFNMISYFHLLIHALFKSMLFMCSGMIIHLMSNNQDIRFMGGLAKYFPFLVMSFLVCKLSLCGFPFMSGFYSKDLIMELFLMNNLNMMCLLILLMSMILTVSYSVRLIFYMFLSSFNCKSLSLMNEGWFQSFSMLLLFIMSIVSGSGLMWMFFQVINVIILSLIMKLMILMLCGVGVVIGVMTYWINFNMLKFNSSMWFLDFLMKYLYNNFMIMSLKLYMNIEKGWLEIYSGVGVSKFLIKLNYHSMSFISPLLFLSLIFIWLIMIYMIM